MTQSEELLVKTLCETAGRRIRAGQSAEKIRRELLAQVERAFARTHTEPELAALIPGKVELAGRVLDEILAGLETGRN